LTRKPQGAWERAAAKEGAAKDDAEGDSEVKAAHTVSRPSSSFTLSGLARVVDVNTKNQYELERLSCLVGHTSIACSKESFGLIFNKHAKL
jgi:hypothetical protein